jgi:hypothetical protein
VIACPKEHYMRRRPGAPAVLAVTVAGLVLAAGSPAAAGQPTATSPPTGTPCPVQQMAVPAGGSGTFIQAVDPTGRYQVGYSTVDEEEHALIWDGGQLTDTGRADFAVGDVNAAGTVVGMRATFNGGRAARYQAGTRRMTLLAQSANARQSRARAINSAGLIGGDIITEDNWRGNRPVLWSGDQLIELAVPAGYNEISMAGLDDSGTVLGMAQFIDYENAVVDRTATLVWDAATPGTFRVLPDADPDSSAALRNGRILGRSGGVPQVWNATTLAHAPVGLSADQNATILNAVPSMLVTNSDGTLALFQGSSTLRPLPMPPPQDPGPGMSGVYPAGLADNDIAYGSFNDGVDRPVPVRWDCRQ